MAVGKENKTRVKPKQGGPIERLVHKFIVYDADFSFSASVEAGDSDI